MPLGLIQLGRIVYHRLQQGLLGVCSVFPIQSLQLLVKGDEALLHWIPVNPCIAGHLDTVDKLDVNPVVSPGNRQAFLYQELSPLNPLRPD